MADVYYTDDLVAMYQEAFDQLRSEIGRDVTIAVRPSGVIDCPNCRRDMITGASSYRYLPVFPYPSGVITCEFPTGLPGPRPFMIGPCPICSGQGRLRLCGENVVFECFVRVIDNPDDYQPIGIVKIGDFVLRCPDIAKDAFEKSESIRVDGFRAQVRRVTQLYFRDPYEVEVLATRTMTEGGP